MPARPLALPEPDSPASPFLFSADTIQQITDEEQKERKYTAARCPEPIRQSIIQLLKESRTLADVASLLHVHELTVSAIYNDPEAALEIDKGRKDLIAPLARRVLAKELFRLDACPGIVPPAAIGMLCKNLYDMQALEDGKPTERSEHLERVDIFAEFRAFTAEIKMEAEKMGLPGKEKPVIQAAGSTTPGQEPSSHEAGAAGRPDPKSEHPAAAPWEDPERVTANVTDPVAEAPTAADPGRPPGGGDGPAEGRPDTSTDTATRNFRANGASPL